MASVMPLSLPGGLASITTSGTPLTNSVTSGRMFGARPAVATVKLRHGKEVVGRGVVPVDVVDWPDPDRRPNRRARRRLCRGATDRSTVGWPPAASLPAGGDRSSATAAFIRVSSSHGVPSGRRVDLQQCRTKPLLEKDVTVR